MVMPRRFLLGTSLEPNESHCRDDTGNRRTHDNGGRPVPSDGTGMVRVRDDFGRAAPTALRCQTVSSVEASMIRAFAMVSRPTMQRT